MYHASENFCDAEKMPLKFAVGGLCEQSVCFLKCDVIIRVFFQFVVL